MYYLADLAVNVKFAYLAKVVSRHKTKQLTLSEYCHFDSKTSIINQDRTVEYMYTVQYM
jgi:hypothetical protein